MMFRGQQLPAPGARSHRWGRAPLWFPPSATRCFTLLGLGFLLSVPQSADVPAPIRFEEIAQNAHLTYITANAPTDNRNQPQTTIAGVALLDYDGDGYLDVYLVGGAAIPSLQKETPAYWNRLFHNNGDCTFTDVTEKAGLAGAGYGSGVAVGDYDNDGWPEIFLANVTGNQLFHNNGDGTFTPKMWSVGTGWLDYNLPLSARS